MEFKGTKESWKQDGLLIFADDYFQSHICKMSDFYKDDISLANATLIAASKDLLKALQDMIFIFESLCESEKLKLKPTDFNCYNDSKAAINKALTIK
jgi:hypothetical protein